jgi:hypothetical protein
MAWFWVWQVVSAVIELVKLGRRSESEEDLGILLCTGSWPSMSASKSDRRIWHGMRNWRWWYWRRS